MQPQSRISEFGDATREDAPNEISISVSVNVKVEDQTVSESTPQQRSEESQPRCQFLSRVQHQAQGQHDKQFCVWLDEKMLEEDSRTFGELWERAAVVANTLVKEGVAEGDRVILCFNFGLQFLDAFMGCLRLGAIAVPVYPPNPMKLREALQKLALVAGDCDAKLCLLDKSVDRLRASTRGWPDGMEYKVPRIDTTDLKQGISQRLDRRSDQDVAFLQYTSGSTGEPKGVMLTFGNIESNLRLSNTLCPQADQIGTVGCCWLPQFHDMGLLFCTLYPLARGRRQIFMSPTVFIKQPVAWVQAMSSYKCTWTTAPNFAYGLCARKYGEMSTERRPKLDLSHVVALGNAAEPVRQTTMREFVDAFLDCGLLQRAHFFPSYGLAEHTVAATRGAFNIAQDPTLAKISDRSGKFVCSGILDENLMAIEGSKPLMDVRIVVDGEEVEDGRVGEIWLRSASRGNGYWGMAERSAEAFQAALLKPLTPLQDLEGLPPGDVLFLRTGDEGFVEAEEESGERRLFVCGRGKDVIIIRGKNIYPQDVEATGERVSGGALRLNCSAAFQSQLPDNGGDLESADMVCELKGTRMSEGALRKVCDAIAGGVKAEHSLHIRRLVLIRPRSIPKTTSGKIRRKETRRALENGELMSKAMMVWEDVGVELRRQGQRTAAREEELGLISDKSLANVIAVTTQEVCLATGLEEEEVLTAEGGLTSLGLESITAVSLTHRLSSRLGVEVRVEEITSATSIPALAAALLNKESNPSPSPEASEPATSQAAPVQGADGPERAESRKGLSFRTFRQMGQSLGGISMSRRSDASISSENSFTGLSSSASSQFSASDVFELSREQEQRRHNVARASALSIALRLAVHVTLCFWILLSVYLCAVPAVAVFELVTDIQIFPLMLFRWLLEPTAAAPARVRPWGTGNGAVLADLSPSRTPLLTNIYVALPVGLLALAGSFLLIFSAYAILLKWLLLGRVQEGKYPLWGFFYWRRWLVHKHLELLFLLLSVLLQDAAPLGFVYMLLGARVEAGSAAMLPPSADIDFDLLGVGARAVVSSSATLLTSLVSGSVLHLARIQVGPGSEVGPSSVLCPGVLLPGFTLVSPHSLVIPALVAALPAGTTLEGVPAKASRTAPTFAGSSGATAFNTLLLPAVWIFCLVLQASACVLPIVAVHELWLSKLTLAGVSLIAVALLDFSLYLLSLSLFTLAAKWLLLGRRLRAGARVPRGSGLELGRECVRRLHQLVARFVLPHCWGGLAFRLWYRAMGARVGSGTVFSMGLCLSDWDAVEIGPVCLLGGGSTLETSTVCPQTGDRLIQGVTLGEGVAVGTNAYVGAGSRVGERVLVGVLSHISAQSQVPAHSVVMGCKAKTKAKRCFVPKHAVPYTPPLVLEAGLWVLYATWTLLAVWGALYAGWWLRVKWSLPALFLFPFCAGVYQLTQLLLVVLFKLSAGRMPVLSGGKGSRDLELWTFSHSCAVLTAHVRCCRYQWVRLYSQMFLYHVYDLSLLGQLLRGGPLANLLLRSLRAQVHMDAFINSLWIFDFEQVEIGHGAAINHLVSVSPHVIVSCASARLQRISVAPGATVWPRAILLGETSVPSRAELGPLSRMVPASTRLALEELEQRQDCARREKFLVGVPASVHVPSGLAGEGEEEEGLISSLVLDSSRSLPVPSSRSIPLGSSHELLP